MPFPNPLLQILAAAVVVVVLLLLLRTGYAAVTWVAQPHLG